MKTLYVHIGTMKTGSTAIQIFLHNNGEYLKENGFVFPERVVPYSKPLPRNGVFLGLAASSGGDDDEAFDRAAVDREIAMLDECFSKWDNVILSEETAWHHITADRKEVWKKLTSHFRKAGIAVKVIVYLRRQDLFVESYWKQAVKHSRYRKTLKYCTAKLPKQVKTDYLANLDLIASTVGEENIIVRRYQNEDLTEGDIVIDFLSVLGLPVDDVRDSLLKDEKKNTSITNNAAEIARELNNIPELSLEQSRRFKPYLKTISDMENKRKYKTSMFSAAEAAALVEMYRRSNDKLAEKYIGDGKPLFNREFNNAEKWTADNPYYLSDVIRFMGAFASDLLDRTEKLEKRIAELEAKEKRSIFKRVARKVRSVKKK